MPSIPGDGSGISGAKLRGAEVGEESECADFSVALSLYHSAGDFQEATLGFLSRVE